MSMLRWCLAERPDRVVILYYGLRNGTEHAFKQTLADLSGSHPTLKLNVVYSNPKPDDVMGRDFHFTGHVDLPLLRRTLPHGQHQFYVCGPQPMMSSLVPALREWGVPESDLHFEAFGPASARRAEPMPNEPATKGTAVIDVQFHRSARSLSWDGRDANLLDFAERHDVAIDSGCRSGSCGACETRLLSGTVLYAARPDHDIAAGHCLMCVGRPQSALVLDA
jgi:ferredoxin-NADP reductase